MGFECTQMICSMFGLREEGWRFEHTHLKMSWIQHQIHRKDGVFTHTPPISPSPLSPFSVTTMHNKSSSSSSGTRISPAVLFIIVILAVLFFISGLLHLLVRFISKHRASSGNSESNSRYPETSSSDALQRQLQQLFHLHDAGLDQAFIDALPVFMYKEIVGLKEPFDCAVCLSEFSDKDKLRLLPTCSHAFHISCIDTWLLSNSTCPLCRDTLFNPDFSIENPIYDFDYSREDDESGLASGQTQKTIEIEQVVLAEKKGGFPVRLGKFRKLNVGEGGEAGGETSSRNMDARRCYSMGSYEYVVADSTLKVALSHKRDLKLEKETVNPSVDGDMEGKKIGIGTKTDSYSVSKIWLWSKKGKFASSAGIQMHNPSSVNTDFPWLDRTQGT